MSEEYKNIASAMETELNSILKNMDKLIEKKKYIIYDEHKVI